MILHRAVFLDAAPLDQGDLDFTPLHAAFDELVCHVRTDQGEIAQRLAGAQVAIVNKITLGEAEFASPVAPTARYVRLKSLSGIGGFNYAAIAELELLDAAGKPQKIVKCLDLK